MEARLTLLDLPELAPGETGLAQLRLQAPVAALPGQRFILRGARPLPGRGATLAGGRVLTIGAPRRRRGATELLAPMRGEDLDARLVWLARAPMFIAAITRPGAFWIGIASVRRSISSSSSTRQ